MTVQEAFELAHAEDKKHFMQFALSVLTEKLWKHICITDSPEVMARILRDEVIVTEKIADAGRKVFAVHADENYLYVWWRLFFADPYEQILCCLFALYPNVFDVE